MVLLIENYNHFLKVYHSDGHLEIIDQPLKNYVHFCKQKNKYKNPVKLGDVYLYPTQNMRDEQCRWVNLSYLDHHNDYFVSLLKEKNIFEKVINEYIAQKKKQFIEDGE